MKTVPVFLAAVLLLSGCSRKSADTPPDDGNVHNVSTNGLPFTVTVVETDQTKAMNALARLSLFDLEKQDYDELDKLAAEGRSAQDAWPDGSWRVMSVYRGLQPSDGEDDSAWLARQKAIEAWVQARPQSITARVALANHLVNYAWKARGSGYTDTVSDEGAQLFEQRLRQAVAVLGDAKDVQAKCPVYWTTAMTAALGLGLPRDRFDRMFQQAIQAYPDCTLLYIQRGLFLLPRWCGTEGEWVADLTKSADAIGGVKGDILYARVAWALKGFSAKKNVFEDYPTLSWERVDRGWNALEKQFPDSLEVLHIHGHLAALAGDGQTAKRCLIKTEGKVTLTVWSAKGEFIDFANWANAQ